jgi:hypothetical protein
MPTSRRRWSTSTTCPPTTLQSASHGRSLVPVTSSARAPPVARKGGASTAQQFIDLVIDETKQSTHRPNGFNSQEIAKLDQFLNQWIRGTQINPPFTFGNPNTPTITGTNFWPVV